MSVPERNKLLAEGKHVRLVEADGWEFAERPNVTGIVGVVAITDDSKLVLVEQFRTPVRCRVIELPAGLAGDGPGAKKEDLITAARRELLEETGFTTETMDYLTEGPPSAGIVSEIVTFFKATNLEKITKGGGDESENITVHEVPIDQVAQWLQSKLKNGILVDPKVYLALYFAHNDQGK